MSSRNGWMETQRGSHYPDPRCPGAGIVGTTHGVGRWPSAEKSRCLRTITQPPPQKEPASSVRLSPWAQTARACGTQELHNRLFLTCFQISNFSSYLCQSRKNLLHPGGSVCACCCCSPVVKLPWEKLMCEKIHCVVQYVAQASFPKGQRQPNHLPLEI